MAIVLSTSMSMSIEPSTCRHMNLGICRSYLVMAQTLNNQKNKNTSAFCSLMLNLHRAKLSSFPLEKEVDYNNNWHDDSSSLYKHGRQKEAKLLHSCIIKTVAKCQDIYLENKLVNLYAKSGRLLEARRVLAQMSKTDAISWTTVIAAYAKHGNGEEALAVFSQMHKSGIQPDQFTFASILPTCDDFAVLKGIHEQIIVRGFDSDVFVGNALIDMYAKCGSVEDARELFDKMPQRDVVSWNTMIAGYAKHGHIAVASELFEKMPERDVVSLNVMIALYAENGYIAEAWNLFKRMPERDVVSWNAMVAGYAQNGLFDAALKLFEQMPKQNLVSWNAMIGGYARNGYYKEALKFYQQMQVAAVKPNPQTFAILLPACANLAALEQGKELHATIIRLAYQSNIVVASALVDMYAKCGSMENARNVFDKICQRDVISWNLMIAGYARNGYVKEALKCFQKMPKQDIMSWNSMIGGYAQNGQVSEALKLFQKMPKRNVVSWNTIITVYSQNGYAKQALEIFQQMQSAGVKPDLQTFACAIPACANLATLIQGKEIHEEIIRNGFVVDVFVGSALIDMYAKCGIIEDARRLFVKMPQQNVVSWNAMIAAYAMHGHGKEALSIFEEMLQSRLNPDHVTFVGILSACCHAGLVDEGWQYFNCMTQHYHITPTMEHYVCMVDLLGRAGHLAEAQNLIERMHIKAEATVWMCLLGACRINCNVVLGEQVAEHLLELNPKNSAPYVLLSNIYAVAGRWDDIQKLRRTMRDRGVRKEPGCSWIEVNKQLHAFLGGDRSHPQMQRIYPKSEPLTG